jgi:hypothetical protein
MQAFRFLPSTDAHPLSSFDLVEKRPGADCGKDIHYRKKLANEIEVDEWAGGGDDDRRAHLPRGNIVCESGDAVRWELEFRKNGRAGESWRVRPSAGCMPSAPVAAKLAQWI